PLAQELKAAVGDTITLHLQKMSAVPRESLLGRPEASEVVDEIKVTVRAVLGNQTPGSRFNLNPSPTTPRNAYVPLPLLQSHLTQNKPNLPRVLVRRPIN